MQHMQSYFNIFINNPVHDKYHVIQQRGMNWDDKTKIHLSQIVSFIMKRQSLSMNALWVLLDDTVNSQHFKHDIGKPMYMSALIISALFSDIITDSEEYYKVYPYLIHMLTTYEGKINSPTNTSLVRSTQKFIMHYFKSIVTNTRFNNGELPNFSLLQDFQSIYNERWALLFIHMIYSLLPISHQPKTVALIKNILKQSYNPKLEYTSLAHPVYNIDGIMKAMTQEYVPTHVCGQDIPYPGGVIRSENETIHYIAFNDYDTLGGNKYYGLQAYSKNNTITLNTLQGGLLVRNLSDDLKTMSTYITPEKPELYFAFKFDDDKNNSILCISQRFLVDIDGMEYQLWYKAICTSNGMNIAIISDPMPKGCKFRLHSKPINAPKDFEIVVFDGPNAKLSTILTSEVTTANQQILEVSYVETKAGNRLFNYVVTPTSARHHDFQFKNEFCFKNDDFKIVMEDAFVLILDRKNKRVTIHATSLHLVELNNIGHILNPLKFKELLRRRGHPYLALAKPLTLGQTVVYTAIN